jgi:cyanate permease
VAIGALAGPVAAGLLYDATESYHLAIIAGVAANLVAAAIAALETSTRSKNNGPGSVSSVTVA